MDILSTLKKNITQLMRLELIEGQLIPIIPHQSILKATEHIAGSKVTCLMDFRRWQRETEEGWRYGKLEERLNTLELELKKCYPQQRIDPIVYLAYLYYIEERGYRDIAAYLQEVFRLDFPQSSISRILRDIFGWKARSNGGQESALTDRRHMSNGSGRYAFREYNRTRTAQRMESAQSAVQKILDSTPTREHSERLVMAIENSRNLREKVGVILGSHYRIEEPINFLFACIESGMSYSVTALMLTELIKQFVQGYDPKTGAYLQKKMPIITSSEINKLVKRAT